MTATTPLDKLDRIQIALNALRWEFRVGNVDFESADMREFLLAAYDLTEVDGLYSAAMEIPDGEARAEMARERMDERAYEERVG